MDNIENLEKAKERINKMAEDFKGDKTLKPILRDFLMNLEEVIQKKDPSNYLLLPQNKDHSDLLVTLTRLAYGSEVQTIAEELKLRLGNNDQGFIGDITFEKAKKLCLGLDGFMTTPSYFVEKLKLLNSGKAFDGAGRNLSSSKANQALNDITELRNPWRAEWLNHKYSQKDSGIFVTYTKFVNGKLELVTEHLDEDTLMEDKTPGISLDDWVNNPTSQGLPRKDVKKGSLYFWKPRENSVAGFGAGAGWVGLYCFWDHAGSYSALGVRLIREKK